MRTLSRFALIGMIGGGAAACSSDASRLGDPFTNPFSSLAGEPSATGSLPDEGAEGDLAPTPAIRTPRVQSQALPAPALSPRPTALGPSPTPAAARVATAEPIGAVAGMNPDAGRAMTPRASAPAPAPRLQFGKPIDKAAEKAAERAAERKAAEAVAAKAAERAAEKAAEAKREAERQAAVVKAAEAKIAEAKAAEKAAAAKVAETKKLADVKKAVEAKKAAEAEAKKAESKLADAKKHVRPGQTAKVETKSEAKADPKAEARKSAEAEAARKAEAEARQAKADATKKLAEARAAESAAKATAAKEAKEAKEAKDRETRQAAASAPAPTVKVASAEATAPVAAPAAPAQTAESFRWPAKGRIINGYGTAGNEGINIAVPEGTPVKAAEDGTVAYAGSDVKGYGKLVLVRHNNGYVSAYAHNGELDVRPGEKVRRGQTIAKSGATGNVTSPQLHFEIRKGATPVDPVPHLASN